VSTLSFEVREIHQRASGGSHVVNIPRDMELLDASEPFFVEMLSVSPSEWLPPKTSSWAVRDPAWCVFAAFEGTGKAARIRVRDFVIHPVDFKPRYVEEYTFPRLRGVPRCLLTTHATDPAGGTVLVIRKRGSVPGRVKCQSVYRAVRRQRPSQL
jgi:hypothetical protein